MMITNIKRIRKWNNYSAHIADKETVYIGLRITDDMNAKLKQLGFTNEMHPGEAVTPSRENGPVSRFNAFGRDIPQKHLPKETIYIPIWWEWQDWSGKHYSEVRYRERQRYPRLHIPAPSVPLTIIEKDAEKFVVAGEPVVKGITDEETAVHKINLMLENFNRAELMQDSLQSFQVPQRIIPLNWEVLPQGDMPWERFEDYLRPVLHRATERGKRVIYDRLETIANYHPDFRAIGANGYRGYIIFGFTGLNLYICESAMYGNATYVFEGEWEHISKLTKAEIINSNLHKNRIVHQNGWRAQIAKLLNRNLPNRFKKNGDNGQSQYEVS